MRTAILAGLLALMPTWTTVVGADGADLSLTLRSRVETGGDYAVTTRADAWPAVRPAAARQEREGRRARPRPDGQDVQPEDAADGQPLRGDAADRGPHREVRLSDDHVGPAARRPGVPL